jgi:hypothetical protein
MCFTDAIVYAKLSLPALQVVTSVSNPTCFGSISQDNEPSGFASILRPSSSSCFRFSEL